MTGIAPRASSQRGSRGLLIAKALLASGNPALALEHADACLATCREHDLADVDLAYGWEVPARALHALGRTAEAEATWAAALAVPIADPEDAKWFARDISDGDHPWQGGVSVGRTPWIGCQP